MSYHLPNIRNTQWHPLAEGNPPSWVSAWGQDKYGIWVEFSFKGVIQKLRWISPGQFLMGSPDSESTREKSEGPQHTVEISKGFWLFDTAVTQALWLAVMDENPSHFKGDNLPVEKVSWEDCQKFIFKINKKVSGLNLSLPTEAQWEYACRAGTKTAYSFGEDIDSEHANYYGDSLHKGKEKGEYRRETVGVKTFSPNLWGVFQMHGNVWEWCLDGRREYSSQNVMDPLGPTEPGTHRVLRGGSWVSYARYCRSATRYANRPDFRSFHVGFRCALVQD